MSFRKKEVRQRIRSTDVTDVKDRRKKEDQKREEGEVRGLSFSDRSLTSQPP
ncbi:hypothetical protein [Microcoleus sp. S13_B4]|uniref:hypothetical protein n=1 Tax=Microcoleus sp. S13_B4 TaxID=3055408 RepID=UPI002FD3DF91